MTEDLGRDPAVRGKAVEPGAEYQCDPLVRGSPSEFLGGQHQHRQSCLREPGVGDGVDVAEVPADLGQWQLDPVGDRAEPDLVPADLVGQR